MKYGLTVYYRFLLAFQVRQGQTLPPQQLTNSYRREHLIPGMIFYTFAGYHGIGALPFSMSRQSCQTVGGNGGGWWTEMGGVAMSLCFPKHWCLVWVIAPFFTSWRWPHFFPLSSLSFPFSACVVCRLSCVICATPSVSRRCQFVPSSPRASAGSSRATVESVQTCGTPRLLFYRCRHQVVEMMSYRSITSSWCLAHQRGRTSGSSINNNVNAPLSVEGCSDHTYSLAAILVGTADRQGP